MIIGISSLQACLDQFLIPFDFTIIYALQGKASALARHSFIAPCLGEVAFDRQKQLLSGPECLRLTTERVIDIRLQVF